MKYLKNVEQVSSSALYGRSIAKRSSLVVEGADGGSCVGVPGDVTDFGICSLRRARPE